MSDVIFYGAGQNAREKWKQWISQGVTPVCFTDADASKHHTLFENELEILPLLEATAKYPDYVLYCTQNAAALPAVKAYLMGIGIPEERIHFCESASGVVLHNSGYDVYLMLYRIYHALQDDLSRTLFWGRVEYSASHVLTGVYRAMLCDDNLHWFSKKRTYADMRYGLRGLWELLKENYPVQKHKLYLLAFDNDWNEYNWVLQRFLEAIPPLGIQISGCVMPYATTDIQTFAGLTVVPEEQFLKEIDDETRIIIGIPGWCLETKDIVQRYEDYKDILFPIADTAHPQYIEPDIFPPGENEIFVDVGVMDFQNSIDFSKWAVNGWEKIYAFEPDPKCYRISQNVLSSMGAEFSQKVELVNKGLSAANGVLEFPAEYKGSGIYSGETIPVEVVSLDSYLDGAPVTFVKMDVEGAEMDVLTGMKETIQKHKPKLAVCIYHKPEDLFEIASYLLGLVPEYKFYIRHYNSNETEAVLFCKI